MGTRGREYNNSTHGLQIIRARTSNIVTTEDNLASKHTRRIKKLEAIYIALVRLSLNCELKYNELFLLEMA